MSIGGVYIKDGTLWRDREDFEYREWAYWIAENTGFTWDHPGSDTPDNFIGVGWFACSNRRHDTYEEAEQEALAYAKKTPGLLVRVTLIQRVETSVILNS